jgi:TRAP transporter TAXI family solute receptor
MQQLRIVLFTLIPLLFGTALAQGQLSISTGGTGGVYYPVGAGYAELINKYLDGYTAVAEVTGASVENAALISRGDSDIALILGDTTYQAYNGVGHFDGSAGVGALPNLRALASAYSNVGQFVTLAGSGITTLQDLKGKRVSVGAPGSGTEISAQTILSANGITYDDFRPQRLNFNETADALRNGDIEAGFWSVGPPTSSIMDLATTRDIFIIPLSDEEVANAIAAEPTFAPYTLPGGTYTGQDEDVPTLGTPNVIVVAAEMDDQLAYDFLATLFGKIDEIIAIHPSALDTTADFSLVSTPIPLHPAAVRYYQDQGHEVPERLLPPQ